MLTKNHQLGRTFLSKAFFVQTTVSPGVFFSYTRNYQIVRCGGVVYMYIYYESVVGTKQFSSGVDVITVIVPLNFWILNSCRRAVEVSCLANHYHRVVWKRHEIRIACKA